jgi:hypothetical protein
VSAPQRELRLTELLNSLHRPQVEHVAFGAVALGSMATCAPPSTLETDPSSPRRSDRSSGSYEWGFRSGYRNDHDTHLQEIDITDLTPSRCVLVHIVNP